LSGDRTVSQFHILASDASHLEKNKGPKRQLNFAVFGGVSLGSLQSDFVISPSPRLSFVECHYHRHASQCREKKRKRSYRVPAWISCNRFTKV